MPEQTNGTIKTVYADPSKAFFIDMLTRDISLTNCILDLIDNSVHSLISHKDIDVMEHLVQGTSPHKVHASIDVNLSDKRFSIQDDCGGITIEDAKNGVFLFGNLHRDKTQSGLGVYGIGMKRAMFKIGRLIRVISHTRDHEFKVTIDVDEWEKKTSWDLEFDYARQKKHSDGGTLIEIEQLNQGATVQFDLKTFLTQLVNRISMAHALFLRAGLVIKLNGLLATAHLPEMTSYPKLKPARHLLKKGGVDILIMAGLSPMEDRTPRGWYVFCNGRMVLEADKTTMTGWGTSRLPAFHSKFNHFIGYVYFRSKDLLKLPWTTTKDGVEIETAVYQEALNQMAVYARPALDFLNKLYSDTREQSAPEKEVFESAKSIDPGKVASQPNQLFTAELKKDKNEELITIQYKRKRKLIQKVREILGKPSMAVYRIGEHTFDYFYDRNCKK